MTQGLSYIIASADLDPLMERMASLGSLARGDAAQDQRTYFDSFDWRLNEADLLLWTQGRGSRQRLVLADRGSATPLATAPRPRHLGFASGLPSGAVRDALTPVLEMRTLLPILTLSVETRPYRLLDDNGKTVLHLIVERHRVSDESGAARSLPLHLRLEPVRGYESWLNPARDQLSGLETEAAADAGLLDQALAVLGRRPRDYSSRLDIRLDPGMRADAAAVRIHSQLLDTLEANLEGTLADLDSEFLHDLRVAVRRARSALSQIKGVFEPDVTQRFGAEFGWLGSVTGETRDLDVFLLEYASYRDALPAALKPHLAPFHDFLVRHQRTAQRRLRRHLRSQRFTQLLAEWRFFLDQPRPAIVPLAPNGLRPVEEVASRRIWRLYRRVLKEGRAIGPETPAEELHELRKSCKKLRYLVEFFRSLYADEPVKALVKALKRLLDNLGEFQDLEVHADHLREYSRQMLAEGDAPLDTLLAMGGLVTGLLQRQAQARQAFAERFAEFDTADNRGLYKALFRGAVREAEA